MHTDAHIEPALTHNLIYNNLPAAATQLLSRLSVFDTLPSTNDYLLNNTPWHKKKFTACIANQQTQGRGRNGKIWASPPNSNIYMSLGKIFTVSSDRQIQCLSLACGVAITRLLHSLGIKAGIKWPNDILFNNKKLAGILIETRAKENKIMVIVGLGLNVNMLNIQNLDIDQPWIDLNTAITLSPPSKQAHNLLERNLLTAQLLSALMNCLLQYETYGFEPFKDEWINFDVLKNRSVALMTDKHTINATVLGINNDCSLSTETNNGKKTFYAADIKLKI